MSKTVELPSGAVAEVQPFKGKHIMQASRLSGGDDSRFIFALISLLVKIDGKSVVMEDVEELDGTDCMFLMKEVSANFTSLQGNLALPATSTEQVPGQEK